MNRRDLLVGALGDLRVTRLPDGRYKVEAAGILAHPDESPPEEVYPTLQALLAARLRRAA